MADDRSNVFDFIIYTEEDNYPKYWQDIIKDKKCMVAVSPLHNFDCWNEYDEKRAQKKLEKRDELSAREIERLEGIKCGVLKKPHRHVIVNFGTGQKKTIEQVETTFADCFPVQTEKTVCERGMYRYLCHLDDEAKHRYRTDEIYHFGGYDNKDYLQLSSREVDEVAGQITAFCDDNGINSYYQLETITRNIPVMHKYVCGHTIFLCKWFDDRNTNVIHSSYDRTLELEQKMYEQIVKEMKI